MPTRIAHVWTPDGSIDRRIAGDWPEAIVVGRWIVNPELDAQLRLLVTRGRHSGAEFLKYAICRERTCEDVPVLMAALGLEEEYIRGDGSKPNADRAARQSQRRPPAAAARERARGPIGRKRRGAQVQGR